MSASSAAAAFAFASATDEFESAVNILENMSASSSEVEGEEIPTIFKIRNTKSSIFFSITDLPDSKEIKITARWKGNGGRPLKISTQDTRGTDHDEAIEMVLDHSPNEVIDLRVYDLDRKAANKFGRGATGLYHFKTSDQIMVHITCLDGPNKGVYYSYMVSPGGLAQQGTFPGKSTKGLKGVMRIGGGAATDVRKRARRVVESDSESEGDSTSETEDDELPQRRQVEPPKKVYRSYQNTVEGQRFFEKLLSKHDKEKADLETAVEAMKERQKQEKREAIDWIIAKNRKEIEEFNRRRREMIQAVPPEFRGELSQTLEKLIE